MNETDQIIITAIESLPKKKAPLMVRELIITLMKPKWLKPWQFVFTLALLFLSPLILYGAKDTQISSTASLSIFIFLALLSIFLMVPIVRFVIDKHSDVVDSLEESVNRYLEYLHL